MKIGKELLMSSNYWVLNKDLVYELGIEAAFLISTLIEADNLMADEEGWFYQTIDTLQEYSTLSRKKQERAIQELSDAGILLQENRGMPMKRYFKIDYDQMMTAIERGTRKNPFKNRGTTKDVQNGQTRMSKTDKLVCPKRTTNKESSNKENTYKESNIIEQQQSCSTTTKPEPQLKYGEESIEINIARQMIDIMLEVKPDSKVPNQAAKDLQRWAQDIDYLIRIDKRNPMDIIRLFQWTQRNDFWVANIRGPRKLREKWDTIELQMQRDKPKQVQNQNLYNLAEMYKRAAEEEEGGLF